MKLSKQHIPGRFLIGEVSQVQDDRSLGTLGVEFSHQSLEGQVMFRGKDASG